MNNKGFTDGGFILLLLLTMVAPTVIGITTDQKPTKKDVVCNQYGCFDHGKFQPNV